MYIDPFYAGVFTVLFIEMAMVVVAGIIKAMRK